MDYYEREYARNIKVMRRIRRRKILIQKIIGVVLLLLLIPVALYIQGEDYGAIIIMAFIACALMLLDKPLEEYGGHSREVEY